MVAVRRCSTAAHRHAGQPRHHAWHDTLRDAARHAARCGTTRCAMCCSPALLLPSRLSAAERGLSHRRRGQQCMGASPVAAQLSRCRCGQGRRPLSRCRCGRGEPSQPRRSGGSSTLRRVGGERFGGEVGAGGDGRALRGGHRRRRHGRAGAFVLRQQPVSSPGCEPHGQISLCRRGGVSPAPVQMRWGWAQSRHRYGQPGAGPVQVWQG